MLYPVQILVRLTVNNASYVDFVVEDQLPVRQLFDAKFRFFNTSATTCSLRIQYTVAQSSVFSDTFTPVNEAVALGGVLNYDFSLPLIQDSLVTHVVRYINGDTAPRVLYGIISGWTDVKQVLSTYIGTTP